MPCARRPLAPRAGAGGGVAGDGSGVTGSDEVPPLVRDLVGHGSPTRQLPGQHPGRQRSVACGVAAAALLVGGVEQHEHRRQAGRPCGRQPAAPPAGVEPQRVDHGRQPAARAGPRRPPRARRTRRRRRPGRAGRCRRHRAGRRRRRPPRRGSAAPPRSTCPTRRRRPARRVPGRGATCGQSARLLPGGPTAVGGEECARSQTPHAWATARKVVRILVSQANRGGAWEWATQATTRAGCRPPSWFSCVTARAWATSPATAAGRAGARTARPRLPRPRHTLVRQRNRAGQGARAARGAGPPRTARPQVVLGSPYVRAASTMEHVLGGWARRADAGARRAAARARPRAVRRHDGPGDPGHLPRGGRPPRGDGQVLLPPAGRRELDRRRAPRAGRARRRPGRPGGAPGVGLHPPGGDHGVPLPAGVAERAGSCSRRTAAPRWATARSPSTGRRRRPALWRS